MGPGVQEDDVCASNAPFAMLRTNQALMPVNRITVCPVIAECTRSILIKPSKTR
jgi:hypothetical protein